VDEGIGMGRQMMGEIDGLEARLARLERRNRLLTACLAVVGIGLALGAVPRQSVEIVQARRIQLVDGAGQVRIDLRHDDEETGLFVLDDEGVTGLGAAQFAHGGGGYALHGPQGRGAAVLYLKGGGSLKLYDAEGSVTGRFPEADQ
jgi:hypothetical protein